MSIRSVINAIKPSFYYLLAALFLLFEMGVQSSPNVMTSRLINDLGVGSASLGVAVGMYFVSYTFMQIPVGLLYDRISAKVILIGATLFCALGAYFFSLADTVWVLGVARFLMGFGSAFAFVGVLVIANQWFVPRYFALLVGIAQLLAAVGAAIGSVLLQDWVDQVGWRHLNIEFAIIGALLSVVMLLFLRQRPGLLSESPSQGHLKAAVVSLKNIIKHPQALWIVVYAFTAWAPITIFPELWGTAYLKLRLGQSAAQVSHYIYYIWGALALTSPFYGWLSDYIGKRALILQFSSIVGLIGFLVLLYAPGQNSAIIIVSMLTIGVAASGQILTFALIRDNFPQQDLAVAIGVVNMGVVMGGFIFQPLTGIVLQWHAAYFHYNPLHYTVQGFNWALVVIPVCYVLGWVVSRFKIQDVQL